VGRELWDERDGAIHARHDGAVAGGEIVLDERVESVQSVLVAPGIDVGGIEVGGIAVGGHGMARGRPHADVRRDERVVVLVTGHGLKTVEALTGQGQPTATIAPTLEAFDAALHDHEESESIR